MTKTGVAKVRLVRLHAVVVRMHVTAFTDKEQLDQADITWPCCVIERAPHSGSVNVRGSQIVISAKELLSCDGKNALCCDCFVLEAVIRRVSKS